jgi:hypothetical protein
MAQSASQDPVAAAELKVMRRSTGQEIEAAVAAAERALMDRNNPLTDESRGSDPAEEDLLRSKLVDYLAERIGDPVFDVFTSGWQTESDPLEVTSSGIESGQQAAHEFLVGDPIEWLLAVGLGVPAPAANEAGAFAADAVGLPGDEFLGHLTFGLRIASIVLCVMSGNPVLVAESTKSLLKNCFIDLMKTGLSPRHTQSEFDPHPTPSDADLQKPPSWLHGADPDDERPPGPETRNLLSGQPKPPTTWPPSGHPGPDQAPNRRDQRPDGPDKPHGPSR